MDNGKSLESELSDLNKVELPEGATENDDGSIEVELKYPFPWGKGDDAEQIKSIKIQRIKAHHMRGINGKALEGGDMDEVFKLVQKLIGQPKSYVDAIDMADFKTIAEVLNYFLPDGQKTGAIA